MPTSARCRTPGGHDDPGVPRRSCPERGMVAGGDPQLSTPIFFLAPQKENGGGAVKRKNTLSLRSYGRGAPCRAAGRGSKLSCSIDAASAGTRAGLSLDFRTQYAVLHSEVIGQRSNLTSCSFRAFRFAKRCLGGRGGGPPFGMVLASIPTPPSHPLAQTLRCAPLARAIAAALRNHP